MSPDTRKCLEDIITMVETGTTVAPVTFTWAYGRATAAAAFRVAKARGLIEVAYISAAGTPVYKAVEPVKVNTSSPWYVPA